MYPQLLVQLPCLAGRQWLQARGVSSRLCHLPPCLFKTPGGYMSHLTGLRPGHHPRSSPPLPEFYTPSRRSPNVALENWEGEFDGLTAWP